MDDKRAETTCEKDRVSRRALLGSFLTLGVSGPSAVTTSRPTDDNAIPTVRLGRTNVKVTRLAAGASFPEYGPRLLQITYRSGVRYFDHGDFYAGYKAEERFGQWLSKFGRRDTMFIVSKSRPTEPKGFVDRLHDAMKKLQVDMIDLFLVHGIEDPAIPLDRDGTWAKLKDRLIREKKIRFMGFSTHVADLPTRIACLNNAVKGRWADVAMCACDAALIRANPDLNRALDTCWKADIGLVAMKVSRGLGKPEKQVKAAQILKPLGLDPHGAMLGAMWSDGRFAVIVSEMPSLNIIEENTQLARTFRTKFGADDWKVFDEAAKMLSRATCPGCDRACRRAAGVNTDFCSITRYLAYYEEDGKRAAARELYSQLAPEDRRWEGADLQAASRACPAHLDFVSIMERVRRHLA